MNQSLSFAKRPSSLNTDTSDINETLILYYLSNKKWTDQDAKEAFYQKVERLSKEQFKEIDAKSKAMAQHFRDWTLQNTNYKKITNIYWTARPDILAAITNTNIKQRENPTDILVEFDKKNFLGISAKCSKGHGVTSMKMLSMGTIDGYFGNNISEFFDTLEESGLKKFGLSGTRVERKKIVKSNKVLKQEIYEWSYDIVRQVNNFFIDSLHNLALYELQEFCEDYIFNVKTEIPFIKVEGYKDAQVRICDGSKFRNIKNFRFEPGERHITLFNGDEKLCALRWGFGNTPLTSGMVLQATTS